MKTYKPYSLHDATRDNHLELFVLNHGPKMYGKPTIVNFTIIDESGTNVDVTVPNTWIPIDLTMFTVKESLLKNSIFRGFVNRGVLQLVNPSEATQGLQDKRAIIEQDRLRKEMVRHLGTNQTVETKTDHGEFKTLGDEAAKGDLDPETIGVSPAIYNLVIREDVSAIEKVSALMTLVDTLTIRDCEYLRERLSSNEVIGKDVVEIVQHAELRLSTR